MVDTDSIHYPPKLLTNDGPDWLDVHSSIKTRFFLDMFLESCLEKKTYRKLDFQEQGWYTSDSATSSKINT